MNFIKCPKCGKEEPAFDYAHVCGPVQVKKSFNNRLRDFERESKLEIFGLGAKRDKWERALTKYAELVIRECIDKIEEAAEDSPELYGVALDLLEHFDIEEFDENQNTEER